MEPNWSEMFSFSVSPIEIVIRGSLMYWFILIVLRLGGRRDFGAMGVADMLVLVLIADAAQNAMAADYRSVYDGMVLVATLVGWTVLIDRVSFYVPFVGRIMTADRVCLLRDGVMSRRNMRREHITEDELMAELRLKGVDDVSKVKRCYIEADGNVSVLCHPDKT
ncbi:MAG TPA: YetF domain-containing protein [Castellaniella sp.]|nr:YetF domain-containing protein [Castellaniella sp.]